MVQFRISSDTRAHAALFIITALIMLGPASPDASAQAIRTRILVLGDSITNGKGLENIPVEYYPGLLRDWLGADYKIIEEGCGGTTSARWSPFAFEPVDWGPCHGFFSYLYGKYAFGNLPADIVTLLLGTNDAVRGGSLEAYEENISDIVEALLDDGAGTVILMTPPRLPLEFSFAKRQTIKQFGEFVLDLCSDMDGVVCGPDLHELLKYPYQGTGEDHFQNRPTGLDDLHPNAEGHEVIANHLYDTILNVPEPDRVLMQLSGLMTLGALLRVREGRD